jgi:hypothetical protein
VAVASAISASITQFAGQFSEAEMIVEVDTIAIVGAR